MKSYLKDKLRAGDIAQVVEYLYNTRPWVQNSVLLREKKRHIIEFQVKSTVIPAWTRPLSSDLGNQAGSSLHSPWMGEFQVKFLKCMLINEISKRSTHSVHVLTKSGLASFIKYYNQHIDTAKLF
jgi:hypothetical protein